MSKPTEGYYELLKTAALQQSINDSGLSELSEKLNLGTSARHLAEALTAQISDVLAEVGDSNVSSSERLSRQIELLNELMLVARRQQNESEELSPFLDPPQVLRALFPSTTSEDVIESQLPAIGMAQPWLFTSGKDSPRLLHELQSELSSCDHVDILVSFITVSGVRKIIDTLRRITSADAEGISNTRIRVITTTYIGATDKKALDMLAQLPNCEVRVSLDGRRTRLHAKAWIFERSTGFGSAYVGSANLSGAALLGGLEWTVKFTQHGQQALFDRAKAHFETLWQDEEFQAYDPDNKDHVASLEAALARESGVNNDNVQGITTFFDLKPKPFQRIILDQLQNERAHDRFRNLLVAATGTGKTVMAAFDYKALCEQEGGQPRLLFVAHREEILKQSLNTYRQVLRDGNFGELLTGRHSPARYEHLFTTVQSAVNRNLVENLGDDYWRMVVIDECHHIEAKSFLKLVETIRPKFLLGLTATPERSDNRSILRHFDARPDGSPSVQLRLWHALEQQLLTPFEYYACSDNTSYDAVPWRQPGETEALSNILTGNDMRAQTIINSWQELVSDIRLCRALAFCVSIDHAKFMTRAFNKAGIKAELIIGDTSPTERNELPRKLERREINILVTVDLFNEGVDLPFVDTLLLLRPTQSATLFQQQIGRGLRLHEGKESCLILDFIGQYRAGFRFDVLYGAITGLSRKEIVEGVESGFVKLPAGCHLQLQKQARDSILEGLRTAVNFNWARLTQELAQYRMRAGVNDVELMDFVREQELDLKDIYRYETGNGQTGWTTLKRSADLITGETTADETYFSRRFAGLLHVDDIEYLAVIREVGKRKGQVTISGDNQLWLLMLAYQVSGGSSGAIQILSFLKRLQAHPHICHELEELAEFLDARTNQLFKPLPGMENTGLKLHGAYKIREILAAVGYYTETNSPPFQAGVLRLHEQKIELMFVTLDKSDSIHEGVAYDDYAVSREQFHWQSQNSAAPDTPTGQRYIDSAINGWNFQLFVRVDRNSPYRPCGPVEFVHYHGEQPMNITWRLKYELTARLFQEYSVIR